MILFPPSDPKYRTLNDHRERPVAGDPRRATVPVGPPPGTTWNPADKSVDITLSNGDLTANSNGSGPEFYSIARSTTSKASGKVFFEAAANARSSAGDYAGIGLATALALLDEPGTPLGFANDGDVGFYANGNLAFGGSIIGLTGYAAGTVLGCAVDLDAGKGWISRNGAYEIGDPAAGTGEMFTFTPNLTLFASFNFLKGGTDRVTANFGATAFAFAPPAGFSPWL